MYKPDFFIFGKHRSGSTMLTAMLNSHPKICVLNDSLIYQMFALSLRDRECSTNSKVNVFKKLLLLKPSDDVRADKYRIPFEGLPTPSTYLTKLEKEQFILRLLKRYYVSDDDTSLDQISPFTPYAKSITDIDLHAFYTEKSSVKEVLDKVFDIIVRENVSDEQILGEKSPPHSFLAPWLRNIYPESKFITLVRNPITNIASMFSRYDSIDNHLLVKATDRYMSFHHKKLDVLYDRNESLVLRYEDIVRSPDENLEEIYAFLDIPEDKIYKGLVSNRPNYTGSKIDKDRAGKSQKLLSEKAIKYIKSRCSSVLKQYYPDEL